MFEQLTSTLTTRPLTFAKFSFQKAELEQDEQLRPIVGGIYQNQKQGSMLTSELWSKKQFRQYLKQTNTYTAKGVLKRFAHWEWDQNSNKDRFKNLTDKVKQTIYTNENELVTKLQLGTSEGEKKLRQKILRDWRVQKSYDIQKKLEKYKDSQLLKQRGTKYNQSNQSFEQQSLRQLSKNNQLIHIITELSELQEDTKKDKKKLDMVTQQKRNTNRLQKINFDQFLQD
ncbi:unnamed protein product (macronuclear) [Paramecium tetraurelia]|uniref:Uncharacterized protein n=1 Tax=Paramecium tetraurelia TaxID=5888 RepID=A0C8P4_PARTE|nr:uncharacterized protein GSPATT00036296001 [Paramecium tetraurelia]CAK67161.1 unnamed protein product [Paramecium tetraurelia]|eukprot:XP_001434558.1 hypothetical protein (macronuclear) [Paramecium tetraurelia strain d4-2]